MALDTFLKKDNNIFFVVVLSLIFLIFLYSFSYWHIFSIPQSFTEIYLTSYDKTVSTQDACFSFVLHSSGQGTISNLVFFLNKSKISDESLALAKDEKKEIKKCILNANLAFGTNHIVAEYSGQNVSFNISKLQNSDMQSVFFKGNSADSDINSSALYSNPLAFLMFFVSFFVFIYLFSRRLGLVQGILFCVALFAVYSLIRIFLNYFSLYQNQLVL